MSRLDRQFAAYRERALAAPMTKANRGVSPEIELPGGVLMGLSVNK
jgi:hypothetical protein